MIARKVAENMSRGSMIRKMFEEGNRLKARYGTDQVYDFSLGNPDLEPPAAVREALSQLCCDPPAGLHSYMSNNGYESTRRAVADRHSRLSGLAIPPASVCMTVGAAGALNVVLKTLLDPGDEVIVLAPFFFEYLSYIDNHGGKAVVVACDPQTLLPDLDAISAALTERTRALIINSPNNPSGVIYPARVLEALDDLLGRQDHTIVVLSDEPYADLAYDGQVVPSTLAHIRNVVVCTSWSKSLSLPGERIGCLVVSPRCDSQADICQAMVYCNRILGFVNAPALFQRVIERSIDARVDISLYERRRDMLVNVLRDAGFKAEAPQGGLYLFPPSPDTDDVAFVSACAARRILAVPGSGFWFPGRFRLCFAVKESTILQSAAAFKDVGRQYGLI